MDAIFTIKTFLSKRREHGKETWILFLDQVKAFDSVPRAILWKVLLRLGTPPKIVSLVKALHERVVVNFQVGEVEKKFMSTIGVKQGDILGTALHTLYMVEIMYTSFVFVFP